MADVLIELGKPTLGLGNHPLDAPTFAEQEEELSLGLREATDNDANVWVGHGPPPR